MEYEALALALEDLARGVVDAIASGNFDRARALMEEAIRLRTGGAAGK